jgi:hypothetical protein
LYAADGKKLRQENLEMANVMKGIRKLVLSLLVGGALALAAFAVPAPAFAQGCAQCYQSAAASGPRSIQALRNGIVVLIIPPFLICVGVTLLAYRRRDSDSENS